MEKKIPSKTVERLSLYRRLLTDQMVQNKEHIYSHELADLAHITATQVRRDLMSLSNIGNPRKGYNISETVNEISKILGSAEVQKIALFGVGNLGRAILSYFVGRLPDLPIVASFDKNPEIAGRVIAGCRCYNIEEAEEVLKKENVEIAILTIPPENVQNLVDQLLALNVKSFLNFTHVPLKVPDGVFVENLDITLTIEKAAYFATLYKKTNT